jgi:hypothetical protein
MYDLIDLHGAFIPRWDGFINDMGHTFAVNCFTQQLPRQGDYPQVQIDKVNFDGTVKRSGFKAIIVRGMSRTVRTSQ